MEVSPYIELFALDSVYYLYNSYSNSFAEIDEILFMQLKQMKKDPSVFDEINKKEKRALINDFVLIEHKSDLINQLYLENMFSRSNKDVLGLTIIPTMACNFDCIYCYEKDRPDVFMDRKTTNSIINFIKKFEKVDSIHIQWYGGEPLMAFDKIKEITQRIFRIEGVKNKNIVYSSDLVTNAYLLTETLQIRY